MTTTLDELRADCDAYIEAADREYYLHGSGQKQSLELAEVHRRFGGSFTPEALRAVLDARAAAAAGSDEHRRLSTLALMVAETCMERELAPLVDELGTAEATAEIEVDGSRMGYYAAGVAIANEPDRDRRRRLDQARLAEVERLNPLRERLFRRHHGLLAELGLGGYVDVYSELKGIDLAALGQTMQEFLDRTDDLWREAVAPWFEAEIGVPFEQAERHDPARLFRMRDRDAWFGGEQMLPALRETLLGLGVAIDDQPNVILDLEERPTKSPRAFCAPVKVPDEVFLVIRPSGGYQDWRALFHEAGHTEHFAHVAPGRPVEHRRLGDNSVTEAFAFTFEHLLLDGHWIGDHTAATGEELATLLRRAHTYYLYFARRYAAKLTYELELHGGGPEGLTGMPERYRQLLTSALGFQYDARSHLDDVDPGFYVAQYLRAWMLEAQLNQRWRELHGDRWWKPGGAGDELRSLWSLGQALPAHLLTEELGLGELGIAALEARIRIGLRE